LSNGDLSVSNSQLAVSSIQPVASSSPAVPYGQIPYGQAGLYVQSTMPNGQPGIYGQSGPNGLQMPMLYAQPLGKPGPYPQTSPYLAQTSIVTPSASASDAKS